MCMPIRHHQLTVLKDNEHHVVLDIPIDLFGAQGHAGNYMLYQTVHQKPIL